MHALVTGATGHVGTVLIKALKKRGDTVTAFVLPFQDISNIEAYCDHILYGDVGDLSSLRVAFRGIDAVFHTAGVIDITWSLKAKRNMQKVNVEGVANVIEAVRQEHVSRLIYISSVHAIREIPHGGIIRETASFNSSLLRGAYAKTKAAGTSLVLEAAKQGIDAVIVHPAGIIGPDDYRMGHMAVMMMTYLTGSLNFYTSGGYNFVDVRDAVNGILSAQEFGKSGECYILAGQYHSVKELFSMMKEITGSAKRLTFIPRWLAQSVSPFALLHYRIWKLPPLLTPYALATLGSNSNYSSEKAERELHYHTRNFRETIEDTISWCTSVMKPGKKSRTRR